MRRARARARSRRRRRPAEPRARLPLRARRDHRRCISQLLRQGDEPDARARRKHALRRPGTRRVSARLDARRSRARRDRRRPGLQAPPRAEGGDDLSRRRGVFGRRHARRAQPGRRLAGSRGVRDPVEPILVLDARGAPDGEHEHRAAPLRRLVDPCRACRRDGRAGGSRHSARRGRAGPERKRPPGGRGAFGADARSRRTRRRALRPGRACARSSPTATTR